MKIINELLGFAVLTSPLWLLTILVVVAVVLAVHITKGSTRRIAKIAIAILTVILVLGVPFSDHVVGRVYFNHLCDTQAGPRVYHMLTLPRELWNDNGQPKFITANGDIDKVMLAGRVNDEVFRKPFAPALGIDKDQHQVVDASTNKVLGEMITFAHWGGWIARTLTTSPRARSCKDQSEPRVWRSFYSSLFVEPQ